MFLFDRHVKLPSIPWWRRALVALIVIGIIVVPALSVPAQAPHGGEVSDKLINYHRTTRYVATAAAIKVGGLVEAKRLGFETFIDLHAPGPMKSALSDGAKRLKFNYISLPLTGRTPKPEQIKRFAEALADEAQRPVLVSGDPTRMGGLWAFYRLRQGVPLEIAIEDGKTIGMDLNHENAVRQWAREMQSATDTGSNPIR